MANNTFNFVGTLHPCKKTDKFTPYEDRRFDSGWINRTLRFNINCGTNRHTLDVRGGSWADGHGSVITTGLPTRDEKGRNKYDRVEIKWTDRMKPENIEKVAEFRKLIVDLEEYGKRDKLKDLVSAFDNGSVTDEMLEEFNISSEEEAREMLTKSEAKRKVFISEWDFAAYLNQLVNSEKIKGKKFFIRGNIEMSEYEGKFYTRYIPQRVYLAKQDAEVQSTGNVVVRFDANAIDDGSLEETNKYYINGFMFNYDNRRKEEIPCPVTLTLPVGEDEKAKKLSSIVLRNFAFTTDDDAEVKEFGVKINIVDGAEVIPLTEDMLNENERDLLMLGEVTMEQLQRERGGNVYGDRKREWVATGIAQGWSKGALPTAFGADALVLKPIEDVVDDVDMGEEDLDDEDIDI